MTGSQRELTTLQQSLVLQKTLQFCAFRCEKNKLTGLNTKTVLGSRLVEVSECAFDDVGSKVFTLALNEFELGGSFGSEC